MSKALPRQLENDLIFVISKARIGMEGDPSYTKRDYDRLLRLQKLVNPEWTNSSHGGPPKRKRK